MKKILTLVFLLFTLTVSAQYPSTRKDSIRAALEYQMKNYPSSQYRDIYKNFMQDYYGPGHLLNNKRSACDNLQNELSTTAKFEGPDYEPTGFEGNFYRVNLRLISNGTIPYMTYMEAFVQSVQDIVPPDPETWKATWKEIDEVMKEMGLTFVNEEKDRKDLEGQFEEGNFMVHHSDVYNENVNFHYRIISREKFDKIFQELKESE